MGYTSGATMEDRGLRDIDRWREKIEVRLDNRQVFFLFFGSALVACLLFVLGVIVGKRLESRGRAVAPEIEDPLALLDKVAATPRTQQNGVTFPQELFAGAAKTEKANKKTLATLSASTIENSSKSSGLPIATNTLVVVKPEPGSGTTTKGIQKTATTKGSEGLPAEAPVITKPVEVVKPTVLSIPIIVAGSDPKSKGRFTLQISSFQDKKEAENFARKLEGEHPYLVQSDIPGKGIWFRVRLGDYATDRDAKVAKLNFERKFSLIAYVAQR
jgi:septal ring-binding cell division protein DamX